MTAFLSRFTISAFAAFALTACGTFGPLKPVELQRIAQDDQVVVLLRFLMKADGQQVKSFHSISAVDGPGMALGSRETGETRRVKYLRFFSEDTLQDGWVLLVLPRGVHYLAVLPQGQGDIGSVVEGAVLGSIPFNDAPRLRIDVPTGVRAAYVGTLTMEGEGADFLLGGSRYLKVWYPKHSVILNEEATARELFAKHLPDLGPPTTVLMRKHASP